MDSVCEGGAVCACSDRTDATLSTASDGARASRACTCSLLCPGYCEGTRYPFAVIPVGFAPRDLTPDVCCPRWPRTSVLLFLLLHSGAAV